MISCWLRKLNALMISMQAWEKSLTQQRHYISRWNIHQIVHHLRVVLEVGYLNSSKELANFRLGTLNNFLKSPYLTSLCFYSLVLYFDALQMLQFHKKIKPFPQQNWRTETNKTFVEFDLKSKTKN